MPQDTIGFDKGGFYVSCPAIPQQRKPSRKVLERLEQIQNLPRRKQDAILTTIDHFLRSATG